jgi:hypothetical protein
MSACIISFVCINIPIVIISAAAKNTMNVLISSKRFRTKRAWDNQKIVMNHFCRCVA